MIHVSFIGRLGNNLIQYSLARFLAESKGYRLTYDTIGHTSTDLMFNLFPNTHTDIQGIELLENPLVVGYDGVLDKVQSYDLDTLLLHDGLIHLKGFFQKHKLFMDHKDTIRRYFDYDTTNLQSGEDYGVVIHIRLGDYVSLGHFIQPSKVYELYKQLNFTSALVLTEDPTSCLLTEFHNDSTCVVQCNSVLQDLHYLATSKNAIISQSTFSWWGCYLGKEKNVYIPYDANANYPWPFSPEQGDIDLIPNQKEYHKIII